MDIEREIKLDELSEESYVSEQDEALFDWSESWIDEGSEVLQLRTVEPEDFDDPHKVLQHYWGYEHFRPLQEDIVRSVLDGHDTLALLPTGGGKSICFQVPGLMLKGITLVITPLVSLMKDQVDNLRARGIKAAAIHSGMGGEKIRQTIANCLYGNYKFLYISPERLASEQFRKQIVELDISLLVIDECHCICQWGYDFRPSYLNVLELKHYVPDVPVIALTATATADVVHEVQRILQFGDDARFFQKSFYRENLSYAIRYTEDKDEMLAYILKRVTGSTIVYCRSRERCREVAKWIETECGVSATFFHAGLTHTEREVRQNRWMRGEIRVMVATNAFGMGIDKPDVRLVVHLTMPSSLEEYFQEAGRAGRDGGRSYAVALINSMDDRLLKRRLQDSFPDREYIMHTYDMLCNYFAIGEGEGLDRSYDFDIQDFIRVCRMRPAQTKPAIDIMELSGWLEYKESDSSSRLMFVYTREELYQDHVGHDELLRALLRNYTGLFADYVFINEGDLALLTGYTQEEIYGMLTALSMQGVLNYIPKKNIPRIIFRIRREDTRYLTLSYAAYQERRERMEERMSGVLRYIGSTDVCRSRLLLEYFGETTGPTCKKCDVCLSHPHEGLRHYIVEDCVIYLQSAYEDGQSHIKLMDLVRSFPQYNQDDLLAAVQYLAIANWAHKLEFLADVIEIKE